MHAGASVANHAGAETTSKQFAQHHDMLSLHVGVDMADASCTAYSTNGFFNLVKTHLPN